jgi:hypothetical protein
VVHGRGALLLPELTLPLVELLLLGHELACLVDVPLEPLEAVPIVFRSRSIAPISASPC